MYDTPIYTLQTNECRNKYRNAKSMNHFITFWIWFQHGRLKVRTSEEKAAAEKRKEKEHVVAYRAGMSRVLAKKQRGEFDAEAMSITAQILEKCPDIATLWNIRRQFLLGELQQNPETEAFTKELEFTVVCLRANPKSYCIWHHRSWCMETSAKPDWTNELALCTKFLSLDERNCEYLLLFWYNKCVF